jgi:hypothetical protein
MITTYIIIGFIYGFIVTLGTEQLISNGGDKNLRFNFIETLFVILFWPIYLGFFIHHIMTQNNDNK